MEFSLYFNNFDYGVLNLSWWNIKEKKKDMPWWKVMRDTFLTGAKYWNANFFFFYPNKKVYLSDFKSDSIMKS